MGILRDRMVEEMKLRNFSAATQESYLYAATRLTKHYRRSPDQLDKEEIRSYLLYLTTERFQSRSKYRNWAPVNSSGSACGKMRTVRSRNFS